MMFADEPLPRFPSIPASGKVSTGIAHGDAEGGICHAVSLVAVVCLLVDLDERDGGSSYQAWSRPSTVHAYNCDANVSDRSTFNV